ncbi:hypothetical protein PMAYCL1PPCAC_16587, partial [Pristionchus mayeri]
LGAVRRRQIGELLDALQNSRIALLLGLGLRALCAAEMQRTRGLLLLDITAPREAHLDLKFERRSLMLFHVDAGYFGGVGRHGPGS